MVPILQFPLNRRRLLSAAALVAASRATRTVAQEDEAVLRILGWPTYFTPEVTEAFRTAHNARIEVTPIATPDDAVLFLRAGGIGLYDLVSPSSGLVQAMADSNLLDSIDSTAISQISNLFPPFSDPGWMSVGLSRYAVPILWGSLPMAYAPSIWPEPPGNWLDLRDKKFKNRVVMADDVLGHFWIWNRALGAADPTRVTRDELGASADLLVALKKDQARAFETSVFNALRSMATGRGSISSVGWQSAPLIPGDGETELATAHPQPGDASFCDCLAIVSETKHRDLCHQFIDYMISPETQGNLISRTGWATVSRDATGLIDPKVAALYGYDDLQGWLEVSPIRGYPPLSDSGDGIATYLDWVVAWDRVRTAKM
jgi:spermidine/putrescine-binding protein